MFGARGGHRIDSSRLPERDESAEKYANRLIEIIHRNEKVEDLPFAVEGILLAIDQYYFWFEAHAQVVAIKRDYTPHFQVFAQSFDCEREAINQLTYHIIRGIHEGRSLEESVEVVVREHLERKIIDK